MEENIYSPLTEAEYIELRDFLSTIGAYLPEDKMGYIWGTFNKVRGANENQPCGCASAGGHWKRAVDTLKEWVKSKGNV